MEDFIDWFYHSDSTLDYRYLDWTPEIENSKKSISKKPFDGVVDYAYH